MSFSAAWQHVVCADCGKSYRCTPQQDYYHRPTITGDDRTLTNGVCETCLLMKAGIHPDNIVHIGTQS